MFTTYNQRLYNVRLLVNELFNLFGVDILSACRKNHILATSLDEYRTVTVLNTHVSGLQPTVRSERCLCSLFIVIIPFCHDVTTYLNLARHLRRLIGIDTQLYCRSCNTSTFIYTRMRRCHITDERTALSHTITDSKRNLDFFHYILYIFT